MSVFFWGINLGTEPAILALCWLGFCFPFGYLIQLFFEVIFNSEAQSCCFLLSVINRRFPRCLKTLTHRALRLIPLLIARCR